MCSSINIKGGKKKGSSYRLRKGRALDQLSQMVKRKCEETLLVSSYISQNGIGEPREKRQEDKTSKKRVYMIP